MKLTRAAMCDLIRQMSSRCEIDAEVVVVAFVQRPDGSYLPAVPFGASWMEMVSHVNGRALKAQEGE